MNLKLKLLTYRSVHSSVPYVLRGLMELGDIVQQDQYLSVRPYKSNQQNTVTLMFCIPLCL